MRQHTRSRRSGATPAERYGQLPAAVAEAVGDPGLWGVYALLDLLAGRSGWISTTRLALAGRTHWSASRMRKRLGALESLDLVRAEPGERRATIYRTLRRSGDGRGAHGRLPEAAVAASRSPQLWGLLAWLDLQALAGGGEFLASYVEIGEHVGWSDVWAAKRMRELEAHGLLAIEGSGLHQTIVPLPATRGGEAADAGGGGRGGETPRRRAEPGPNSAPAESNPARTRPELRARGIEPGPNPARTLRQLPRRRTSLRTYTGTHGNRIGSISRRRNGKQDPRSAERTGPGAEAAARIGALLGGLDPGEYSAAAALAGPRLDAVLERVEAGGYRPRSLAYFERAVAAEAEAASGTAGAAGAEDEGGDRRLDHGKYERVVRRNQSDVERLSGPR